MSRPDRPRVLLTVTAPVTARLFLRGYAVFLAGSGYDVHIAASDVEDLASGLAAEGVTVHAVSMSREPDLSGDLKSARAMVRLLKRLRPDIVVYATPKASLLSSVAAWWTRTPVRVYSLWGIRFETARGLARHVYRAIEKVTVTCSTAVIANSESLADRAAALRLRRRDRITVPGAGSSHGVDAGHFDPDGEIGAVDEATDRFLLEDVFTVGYVGRLHPDKGVDTLLNAVARIGDDRSVQTVLVGADEGALASRVDHGPRVHSTGEVADVRPYLRRFDVVVLMSLREGFPNVVLEAAAMRVPAIVSDATGCVDAVLHGVTGFVVPRGDHRDLARRIIELRADRGSRLAMGEAARDRVRRDFDPVEVWSAHEQHLAAQLAARTTSPRGPRRKRSHGARRNESVR